MTPGKKSYTDIQILKDLLQYRKHNWVVRVFGPRCFRKSIGREEEEVLKERQTFSDTRREPSREEEEDEEEATSKS